MSISDEKQYEYITRRISDLANTTHAPLKIFLPGFSAIVGGSIWLRTQIKGPPPQTYIYLSDVLVLLLTVLCIAVVYDNIQAWTGYRKLLTRLTADTRFPAPPPALLPSGFIEIAMCELMGLACILFCAFNPFWISN